MYTSIQCVPFHLKDVYSNMTIKIEDELQMMLISMHYRQLSFGCMMKLKILLTNIFTLHSHASCIMTWQWNNKCQHFQKAMHSANYQSLDKVNQRRIPAQTPQSSLCNDRNRDYWGLINSSFVWWHESLRWRS